MLQYAINVLVTIVVGVAVSELGRRSSFWGSVLASLPPTSLLAFIWIYRSTGSTQTVAALSQGIFWLVLATLPLFLILPALLKSGIAFWSALAASCVITVGLYSRWSGHWAVLTCACSNCNCDRTRSAFHAAAH